jgi:hypothetical protein
MKIYFICLFVTRIWVNLGIITQIGVDASFWHNFIESLYKLHKFYMLSFVICIEWIQALVPKLVSMPHFGWPLYIESFYKPHRELCLVITITTSICVDPKYHKYNGNQFYMLSFVTCIEDSGIITQICVDASFVWLASLYWVFLQATLGVMFSYYYNHCYLCWSQIP